MLPILPEVFFVFAYVLTFSLIFLSPLLIRIRFFSGIKQKAPVMSGSFFYVSLLILFFYFVLKVTSIFSAGLYFFDTFRLTSGVVLYQAVVILLSILVSLFLNNRREHSPEFWLVFLIFVLSNVVLPAVTDLIGLYLLFELQGFTSYILATLDRSRVLAVEAGLKYFVLGAFVSGFLLFGIALFYLVFGTTNLVDATLLSFGLVYNTTALFSLVLIIGAVFFKLSAFPFHIWVADVYSGISLSALISFVAIPKLALWGFLSFGIFPLLKVSSVFEFSFNVVSAFGLGGVLFGAFGAVFQDDIKKFLAYSSIANVGYMLLAYSTGSFEGLFSLIFYVILYAIMVIIFVGLVYSFEVPSTKGSSYRSLMSLLRSLRVSYPVVAFFFVFLLFSMAGIPPLLGFFPKASVITSLWFSNMYFTAVIAGVITASSAMYYTVLFVNAYLLPSVSRVVSLKPFAVFVSMLFGWFNVFYVFFHPLIVDFIWFVVFSSL